MALQKLAPYLDHPVLAHVLPIIFLCLCLAVSVPSMAVHILFHPLTYFPPSTSTFVEARRKFFYFFWRLAGPALNAGDTDLRRGILERANGDVLEIGAGVGDNIALYKRGKVKRLILVEPNVNMHPQLREKAAESGYTEAAGSLVLLSCGGAASDGPALAAAGILPGTMDTVACIHVLCGIPGPARAIELYRSLLRPGGELLFYEHVRSDEPGMAWWQTLYTRTVWPRIFDGCELNRPTGDWIVRGPDGDFGIKGAAGAHLRKTQLNGEGAGGRWADYRIDAPTGQPKYTLMAHVKGWAVKA